MIDQEAPTLIEEAVAIEAHLVAFIRRTVNLSRTKLGIKQRDYTGVKCGVRRG